MLLSDRNTDSASAKEYQTLRNNRLCVPVECIFCAMYRRLRGPEKRVQIQGVLCSSTYMSMHTAHEKDFRQEDTGPRG